MEFNKISRNRIYKHTHLSQAEADRYIPLIESAFQSDLSRYNHGNRQRIAEERVRFAAEQYANRRRIANLTNTHALNEDAQIFGGLLPSNSKLFESFSGPENVIGMGEVRNPQAGNSILGGMNNPGYKPGSGDIATYAFGLQGQIALHCQSFDLVPTIAVDTPKVTINYVDTVYGGGTFADAGSLPTFIEVSLGTFTRFWVRASKLKRSVSTVVVALADGSAALELRFITGSSVKAALVVEVLGTGTFAGGAFTKTETMSVIDVVNKINEAGAPPQVQISVAGDGTYVDAMKKYVPSNDPSGYTASADTTSKLIGVDYASSTRQTIGEASTNNNTVAGMSRAQHEKGPKHKLNVVQMDKQLEMVGLEIEADTNNIQIKDMAAAGINVIAMLYAGTQNQIIQTMDEIVLRELYRHGVQHAVNAYESTGINQSIYIDAPTSTELEVAKIDVEFEDVLGNDVRARMGSIPNSIVSSGHENQTTHANRLYARLLATAEFVAQQNRESAPDFLVAGGEICACLKHNSRYSICPVETNMAGKAELYYTGTIFETINVYRNVKSDFNDPRILLGVRGDDRDPGVKLLAYDLAASRSTIAENTMSDKIRVWSRFALASVGFHPELRYYTMLAINKFQWT